MFGNQTSLADARQVPDLPSSPTRSIQAGRRHAGAHSIARFGPAVAAALMLFALTLQHSELRAELLFRSAELKAGKMQWSELKRYADPADTAHVRATVDATQVATEEVQVFLSGSITSEDVYAAKVMESLLMKGRQTIAGNTVSLASNGGEVDAAIELGRMLRKLRLFTVVPAGEKCMSSCVFAFMGGDRRMVEGRIGIHRPYFSSASEVPDRRLVYRQLQKKLQNFIDELDFPLSLYEAMMAVPPESVIMLSPAALKEFFLEGMSPSTQDEVDATTARHLGVSVTEYLQQKALQRPCAGFRAGKGECDREAQDAVLRAATAIDRSKAQTHGRELPATGSVVPQRSANTQRPGESSGAAGTR